MFIFRCFKLQNIALWGRPWSSYCWDRPISTPTTFRKSLPCWKLDWQVISAFCLLVQLNNHAFCWRGGFGSVYAGVRLKDNKIVAIKHVARDNIRLWCSAHGKSVPKEICLMRHAHGTPNVIKLLDYYERPDSFILILSRPSCYKVKFGLCVWWLITFPFVFRIYLISFLKRGPWMKWFHRNFSSRFYVMQKTLKEKKCCSSWHQRWKHSCQSENQQLHSDRFWLWLSLW